MPAALAARIAGITALASVWMIRIPSTLRAIMDLTCSSCLLSSWLEIASSVVQPIAFAFSRMIWMPVTQNGLSMLSNSKAIVLPFAALAKIGRPAVPAASNAPRVRPRRVMGMVASSLVPGPRLRSAPELK